MIGAYLRERCPPWLILPLAGFVAGPALVAGADPVFAGGAALLLVTGLRLLDDLADREVDRERASERVLVRAEDLRPARALCAALLLGGLALVTAAGGWPPGLLALGAGLAAWYAARPSGWRRLNAAVVLSKYPALAALLLRDSPATYAQPLAGVALALYAYEALHDPDLRAAPLGALLVGGLIAGAVLTDADPRWIGGCVLAGVACLTFAPSRPYAGFPVALVWIGATA